MSWEKDYKQETRPCCECKHFFERFMYHGCSKKLMGVLPKLKVMYPIKEGTCFEVKLKEAKSEV